MESEVTIRFLPLEDKQKIGKFSELLTILSIKSETVRKLIWRLTSAAVKTVEFLMVVANHHRGRQQKRLKVKILMEIEQNSNLPDLFGNLGTHKWK